MIVIKIAIMSHRKVLFYIESAIVMYLKKYLMTIGNDTYKIQKRLKINVGI